MRLQRLPRPLLSIATLWFLIWTCEPASALTTLTVDDDMSGATGFVSIPVELRSDDGVAALQMDVLYDPVLYGPGLAEEPALQSPFRVDTHLVQPGQLRVVVHSSDNRALPAGVFFQVPLKSLAEETTPFPVVLANFVLSTASGGRINAAIAGGVRLTNLRSGQRINGKNGIQFSIETNPQIGDLAKVEYFIDQKKIGETTGAPFDFNWLPVGSGRFEIVVLATGVNGQLSASKPTQIIVTNVGTTPVKGIYTGLIRSNPVVLAESGSVTLANTTLNRFTGKVTLGTSSYPVRGTFNSEGVAEVTITRKNQAALKLWLQLEATNLIDQITGVITDGNMTKGVAKGGSFASEISADRRMWDKKSNPAPQRGRYTIVFNAPDDGAAGSAEGDGYGVITVTDAGTVKLKGKLADGSAVSQSAWLSKDGEWPLFAMLYGKTGGLLGELRFQDIMNTSDLDGGLIWQRRSAAPLDLAGVGSRYEAPASFERMITLQNVAGNALFSTEDDGQIAPMEKLLTISSANRVSVLVPGPDKLMLKLAPATGLFSGSFVLPDGRTKAGFGGAFIQKQNLGTGHFLAKQQRGAVALEPNPAFLPDAGDSGPQGSKPLPVIKIRGPNKGARIDSPAPVSVVGTAVSKAGVSAIFYQVLYNGVITPVQHVEGSTDWEIALDLDSEAGGPYTVFVKVLDGAGAESDLGVATFTYVVLKDLIVNIAGEGTVTKGFAGVSEREIGETYKITAKPGNGRRFAGWTGGVTSASPAISFKMKSGLVLQANFE